MPARRGAHPVGRVAAPVVTLALLLAAAACADDPDGVRGRVVVSAAASLADPFADLEAAFELQHPDTDVVLNLGGSSTLREQVLGGAPVDVYASADLDNMDQLVDAGRVAGDPAAFATNTMQVVTPPGNPAGITGLDDFADDGLLLGLCAEPVPCGDLARQVLAAAGVTASIDTDEPDVRALLTKVRAGELDAGIVYRTDVLAAGDAVEGVAVPDEANVVTTYPIAVVDGAPDPVAARAFVAFVLSASGRQVLAGHGFGPP